MIPYNLEKHRLPKVTFTKRFCIESVAPVGGATHVFTRFAAFLYHFIPN